MTDMDRLLLLLCFLSFSASVINLCSMMIKLWSCVMNAIMCCLLTNKSTIMIINIVHLCYKMQVYKQCVLSYAIMMCKKEVSDQIIAHFLGGILH